MRGTLCGGLLQGPNNRGGEGKVLESRLTREEEDKLTEIKKIDVTIERN
jgi:hypothetical protein